MIFPKSIPQLDALVKNRVPENIHLEYKASAALSKAAKPEMAKDASAFANSDGGVLVYGIAEDQNHDPDRLDGGCRPLPLLFRVD
jgi:predicted HTH transcriptional regulator